MVKKTRRTESIIHAVKGGASPLTAVQRELVGMFISYLRRLPPFTPGDDWGTHVGVAGLLLRHYRNQYPSWRSKYEDLPDGGKQYRYLISNASSADPAELRRLVNYPSVKV